MASGRRSRRSDDPDVRLSKALSYLLRHGAEKEGFEVLEGGYLPVQKVLQFKHLKQYTVEDVKRVVETNAKKRYSLKETETGKLLIRAVQGHSLEVPDLELTKVLAADEIPVLVHATTRTAWQSIRDEGLSRMGRNHIHLAPTLDDSGEIPYFRKSAGVLIKINASRAMAAGLRFWRAANGVLLCAGNEEGKIPVCFFDGAIDRRTGTRLE